MKFDRYVVTDLDIDKLYRIFNNFGYDLFFCCIERNNVLYRYKIDKIISIKDIVEIFNNNSLRRFENGLNSDEINIFESDFIDCYPKKKYPN